MKKRILPLLLCVCMLLSVVTVGVFAATPENGEYTAKIMEAYGGAKGVVSMTFDDGDWNTNVWLDQMFDKYDLYGSTMAIVQGNYESKTTDALGNTVYVPDTAKITKWQNFFANGRLEPESHTYTHLVLPDDKWAESNKETNPTAKDNNTAENYQQELVESKNLIKEYLGYNVVCLAPSNNTLSDGAMAVVKQNYYAVRQGSRFQNVTQIQSLDPAPGSAAQGGWYNLSMLGFYDGNHAGVNSTMPAAIEYASQNGGWIVTMCHGIRETSGDATYAEAEALFKTLSTYKKAGTIWVTTFGNATKYIRERQNSTVSYSYTPERVTVSVTMAEKTADNLPLTQSIFNHPLTVRIELPNGVEQVKYSMSGQARFADAFVEDGKTYAYVDVLPNSGEIEIERVAKGGIFSSDDLVAAIDNGGEYKLAGSLVLDASLDLTVDASEVVIDLVGNTLTFTGDNTFTVPSGKSLTIKNGNVVVAYNYKSTSEKAFGKYLPITETNGSYAIGSATSADALVTGEDRLETTSTPAFSVTGGNLTLNGVSLERSVTVSNGGELLSISAGAVTVKNSKIFESVGAEAYGNAATRLIYMERTAESTKLTVENSKIEMARPNAYYNGTLICADGPTKVDSATGAITKEEYIVDSNDNILICYISGNQKNTGVELLFENCEIQTYQRGFRGVTNYLSTDKFTMRDSRMTLTNVARYKGCAFEFNSGALLFENCYLGLNDNVFSFNDNDKSCASLTMKQCYVDAQHIIANASAGNDIYFEDCYFKGGLLRWRGYNDATEVGAAKCPTIKIAGFFATTAKVKSERPVYGTDSWGSTNNTDNFWVGLERVDGGELNVLAATPAWYFTVKHADGTTSIGDVSATNNLAAGDEIYLWRACTTPVTVKTDAEIPVYTYGLEVHIRLEGEGSIAPVDGTLGGVSILNADGSQLYYVNNTTKTLENTFPTLTTGQTIVLLADQQVIGTLNTNNNLFTGLYPKAKQVVAVDLNGYTVYHTAQGESLRRLQPIFGVTRAQEKIYIYSSRPGARMINGYTLDKPAADKPAGGIMFEVTNGTIALGYGIDGEVRGERIDLVSGQILTLYSGSFLANNTAWYSVVGDNSAVVIIKNSGDKTLYVSNSDFYHNAFNRILAYRDMVTGTASITFENSNIYNYNNSKFFLQEHKVGTLQVPQTVVLKNSSVYNIKLGASDMMRITLDGNCRIYEPLSEYVTMMPGNYYEAKTGVQNVKGASYPAGAIYGAALTNEKTDASYRYNYVIAPATDLTSTLYTNVSLDTALDLNLYVPVSDTLTSVKVDGVEVLDKEAIQTINGKDYFIITVSKAPKDAYATSSIVLSYVNGSAERTYVLEHSLVRYAKSLINRDESKYTGKTLEYLVDSKEIMRYVLNYAKETIESYGNLEGEALVEALAPIEALLGEFALSESDKVLENVKTDLPSGIGAAAAFDLDTKVGFVLGVYNTFTGTVSIRVDDREVTKSFTADENAAEIADMLVLENILAYQLYEKEIEISVQGTNGDEAVDVTFTYNLATYVNSGVSGEVGTALYAYAKEAYAYGYKHSIGTIE